MRVLVAGATGVIGRALLPKLLAAGHTVLALTRKDGPTLPAGCEPVRGDVLDADRLRTLFTSHAPEAVIHQLTAIPPRIRTNKIALDMAATNRVRTTGTKNLAEAARALGISRFVAQSISFAYPPHVAMAEEETPLHVEAPKSYRAMITALAELERHTLAFAGGVVLRYGAFTGPGTIYAEGGTFAADVRARKVPIVGDGRGAFSFVHVDDAADATVRALDAPGGVYNVCCDAPVPIGEWLPAYARHLGAKPPWRVPAWLARLGAGAYAIYLMQEQGGADNARAKRALAWTPAHATWQAALLT